MTKIYIAIALAGLLAGCAEVPKGSLMPKTHHVAKAAPVAVEAPVAVPAPVVSPKVRLKNWFIHKLVREHTAK